MVNSRELQVERESAVSSQSYDTVVSGGQVKALRRLIVMAGDPALTARIEADLQSLPAVRTPIDNQSLALRLVLVGKPPSRRILAASSKETSSKSQLLVGKRSANRGSGPSPQLVIAAIEGIIGNRVGLLITP